MYNEADFIDYSNLQARTMTTDTSDQIVQRIVFNEIPVQGKHSETFPAHAKLNKKQLSEIKEQLFSETGTERLHCDSDAAGRRPAVVPRH